MKLSYLLITLLLWSGSLWATSPRVLMSPKNQLITVKESRSRFTLFDFYTNECDADDKVAELKSKIKAGPFTYNCIKSPTFTIIEIKSQNKLVVSFTIDNDQKLALAVPHKGLILSISVQN